jgi:hypothetical protein
MTIFQNRLKLLSMIRVIKKIRCQMIRVILKIRGQMLGFNGKAQSRGGFIGGIEVFLELSRPMR